MSFARSGPDLFALLFLHRVSESCSSKPSGPKYDATKIGRRLPATLSRVVKQPPVWHLTLQESATFYHWNDCQYTYSNRHCKRRDLSSLIDHLRRFSETLTLLRPTSRHRSADPRAHDKKQVYMTQKINHYDPGDPFTIKYVAGGNIPTKKKILVHILLRVVHQHSVYPVPYDPHQR